MPMHDWTRVEAGTFHDFHLAWIAELRKALNGGVLPPGYYVMAEQRMDNTIPDVLGLRQRPASHLWYEAGIVEVLHPAVVQPEHSTIRAGTAGARPAHEVGAAGVGFAGRVGGVD